MTPETVAVIIAGALAGGLVNGLTGFGTGLVAMGLWLHVLPPTLAAALVTICSVVGHLRNLPMIWRTIEWSRVLPFVLPGLMGAPIGAWLLPSIDARAFKIGAGLVLIAYAGHALLRRLPAASAIGGVAADGMIGFAGGILGGLAGLSGALPVAWADVRGWSKEQRRAVLQVFNLAILGAALASYAWSGMLRAPLGTATLIALPATLLATWYGARLYRRLGDRGYRRIVLMMLLASGVVLIAASV